MAVTSTIILYMCVITCILTEESGALYFATFAYIRDHHRAIELVVWIKKFNCISVGMLCVAILLLWLE